MYVCHLCAHEYEPIREKTISRLRDSRKSRPKAVKVKCPNCHELYILTWSIDEEENVFAVLGSE